MAELAYILLFVGCPLFIFIASMLIKRAPGNLSTENLPFTDAEAYLAIPKEFREKLRFTVRYSQVKRRFATGKNYVYLEEQLLFGNIPLTDWIKHDVPLKNGHQLSAEALRRISMLKQYAQPLHLVQPPQQQATLQSATAGAQVIN